MNDARTDSPTHIAALIAECVHDVAICAFDLDRRIVYWSRGAEVIFGYSSTEMLDRPMETLFSREDREAGVPDQQLQIAAAQGRTESERWHLRKDGTKFWGLGVLAQIRDRQGLVVGYAELLRDRTDVKEMQDTLRNRASELADMNAAKTAFLATLAHELRTPLSVLANCAQLLRDADGAQHVERVAGMMERQVNHTTRIVNDLLDVARAGRHTLRLRREHLDLRASVRGAVEMMQPLITEHRHNLGVHLPETPVVVNADHDRLLQVFANLLNNAVKFTPDAGQITLALTLEGNEAVVRIADNGFGIPTEKLTAIFDLFTQVHTGSRVRDPGLGIGLALARDLVELHQGTIQARSLGVGQGSEFSVRLPLEEGVQTIHT